MPHRSTILFGLMLALLTQACDGSTAPESGAGAAVAEAPSVLASIPPLAMIATDILGDSDSVRSFLPPGGNPHQFSPQPSEVLAARDADLLLVVGLGMDDWALGAMKNVQRDPVPVWVGAEFVNLIPLEGGVGAAEHGRAQVEEAMDPHFWLDPIAAAKLGYAIAEALTKVDPSRAAEYRLRAEAFDQRIQKVDAELLAQLSVVNGTRFIATHAGWAYFARRYGLEQVGVVEVAPGREPGPRSLMHLVEEARSEGIAAVISEIQLADGSARVISEAVRVPVIRLDPFGGPGIEGRETYEALLRWNAQRLVEALAGQPSGDAPLENGE